MEALAALSVAASVVQFVDVGGRGVLALKQIYDRGSTTDSDRLRELADEARKVHRGIHQQSTGNEDIERLRKKCAESCNQMIALLDSIVPNRQKIVTATIVASWRTLRAKKKLEALQKDLKTYKQLLDTSLLNTLRWELSSQGQGLREQGLTLSDDVRALVLALEANQTTVDAIIKAEGESVRTYIHQQLAAAAADAEKEKLHEALLESLAYSSMLVRQDTIEEAHAATFQWLLEPGDDSGRESRLYQWLTIDEPIFWLQGKPGSGKSTLMRMILDDERTRELLERWVAEQKVFILQHFFWKLGDELQKSMAGLLRHLLFQILRRRPDLASRLAQEDSDWISASAINNWTEKRLRAYLSKAILELEQPLCLFVDALDEFEGDVNSLIKFILEISKSGKVKCVLSSRPELILESKLALYPGLRLQDVTERDIDEYVRDRLYGSIQDESIVSELCERIQNRAEGIFLWVRLVVDDLLDRVCNEDTVPQLINRIDASEPGLDNLYAQMLKRLKPDYREDAAVLFAVINRLREIFYHYGSNFLAVMFAVEGDHGHDLTHIDRTTLTNLCETFVKRARAKSCNLLEYFKGTWDPLPWAFSDPQLLGRGPLMPAFLFRYRNSSLSFIHRTAHDFIFQSKEGQALIRRLSDCEVDRKLFDGQTKQILVCSNPTGDPKKLYSGHDLWPFDKYYALACKLQDKEYVLNALHSIDRHSIFLRSAGEEEIAHSFGLSQYEAINEERKSCGLLSFSLLADFTFWGDGRLLESQLLKKNGKLAQDELNTLLARCCYSLDLASLYLLYPWLHGGLIAMRKNLDNRVAAITFLLRLGANSQLQSITTQSGNWSTDLDKRWHSTSAWARIMQSMWKLIVERDSGRQNGRELIAPNSTLDGMVFEMITTLLAHAININATTVVRTHQFNRRKGNSFGHNWGFVSEMHPRVILEQWYGGSSRFEELSKVWKGIDVASFGGLYLCTVDIALGQTSIPSQVRVPASDLGSRMIQQMMRSWPLVDRSDLFDNSPADFDQARYDSFCEVWLHYGGQRQALKFVSENDFDNVEKDDTEVEDYLEDEDEDEN